MPCFLNLFFQRKKQRVILILLSVGKFPAVKISALIILILCIYVRESGQEDCFHKQMS